MRVAFKSTGDYRQADVREIVFAALDWKFDRVGSANLETLSIDKERIAIGLSSHRPEQAYGVVWLVWEHGLPKVIHTSSGLLARELESFRAGRR